MTTTKREEEKEKEEEEEEETTIPRSSSGSSSSSSEKEVRDFIIFSLLLCGVTFFFQKRFEFSFAQKTTRFFSDARGGVSLFRFFLSLKRALTPSLFLSLCVYFFVAGSTAGSVERQRERFGRGRR